MPAKCKNTVMIINLLKRMYCLHIQCSKVKMSIFHFCTFPGVTKTFESGSQF